MQTKVGTTKPLLLEEEHIKLLENYKKFLAANPELRQRLSLDDGERKFHMGVVKGPFLF
jgi:hypothetical protein